jgi:hypothetical protein
MVVLLLQHDRINVEFGSDAIWLRTYGVETRKPATKTADKRAAFKGKE